MDEIYAQLANKDATILIVDDELEICESLERLLSTWGMKAECAASASEALDQIEDTCYNIILLDVVMPEKPGTDLIPEIASLCPETKIIIMTGYADKEMAIEALRLGAFDFLEKPIGFPLFSHSINRALEMQKAEWDSTKAVEDLKSSHDKLLAYKSRLEGLNNQLFENNKALSVLAKNIDIAREQVSKELLLRIRSLIMPIIKRFRTDKRLAHRHDDLKVLMGHLKGLTSELASGTSIATLLSASELRIASLIKNGLTSEEIAQHLNISPSTVKTHRRNIRKKLGINKMHHRLGDYLQQREERWAIGD